MILTPWWREFLALHKLVSFGANSIDEYYYSDHVPLVGEKAILTPSHRQIGGMIGNATSVYASLGGEAAMIDFLPPTEATNDIVASLTEFGIDTSLLTIDTAYHQSRCLILLHEGERIVYVVSPPVEDKTLENHQTSALNPHTTFYSNVTDFDRLTNQASVIASGATIVFDVEETSIRPLKDPFALLNHAHILFINEQADDFLCQIKNDYKELLQARIIVITKGAHGSEIITADQRIPILVCPTTLVDTTGAGDTYNAAFLYQLHQQQPLTYCGSFASAAAARAITMIGPRSGCSTVNDVLDYANLVNYSI
jgi:ribokinase